MTPTVRRLLVVAYDAAVSGVSLWLAYFIRYNFDTIPDLPSVLVYSLVFSGVAACVFVVLGVEKGQWQFASLHDFRQIVVGSLVTVLLFILASFLVSRLEGLPRSVPVIAGLVMVVWLAGSRAVFRSLSQRLKSGEGTGRKRFLLIGDPSDAEAVIRRFGLEGSGSQRVIGIVPFDQRSVGLRVRGISVVGAVADLDPVLSRLEAKGHVPDAILIATTRQHPDLMKTVVATAAARSLPIVRVSREIDLLSGQLEENLKPIDLEDLLGRPPVRLEVERIRALIKGRTVLVTGAGGSIGSEITRQVAGYGPRSLVILDNSEYALYQIDAELADAHPQVRRVSILASVCDRDGIDRIVGTHRPDLIFHAAALKHVPLVEANVCEGVRANLIGTRNVADAAARHGVGAFVMISTDKAVKPSSVMGASKRAAESYCQALDMSEVATRYITVRFGNVLGSNGSVVPLFERQIRTGGPVTVTHPDMKRYFMSIQEATELVLQASLLGAGEPLRRGKILVLDMGEPVKIVDLARTMIAMSGKQPEIDIPLVFTGMRPGEKLFEELLDPDEQAETASVDGLFVASPRAVKLEELREPIERVECAVKSGDVRVTLECLRTIVPEFEQGADVGRSSSQRPSPVAAPAENSNA